MTEDMHTRKLSTGTQKGHLRACRRFAAFLKRSPRDHGAAWRRANAGHVSLGQLKVMSAIERCRTAALGGHVAACTDCAHTQIAYNSCRNRPQRQ